MNTFPNCAFNAFQNYLEQRLMTDPLPWFPRQMGDGLTHLVTRNNVSVVLCFDLHHAHATLRSIVDGVPYDPPLLPEDEWAANVA